MRIRLGNVSYLNAAPLVFGLDGDREFEVVSDTPARVAQEVASGRIDLGLAPVFDAARLKLHAVPGICVGTEGPVRSVLLATRVPVRQINTLAIDPASRTSAALVELLLEHEHGVHPKIVIGPHTGPPLPDDADAALVIGDRALLLQASHDRSLDRGYQIIDLGAWWRETTGLPFVFAIWVGRDRALVQRVKARLTTARDDGIRHLDEVAAIHGPACGVPETIARHYLHEALRYDLGPDARRGLDRYLELLRGTNRLQPDAAPSFVD